MENQENTAQSGGDPRLFTLLTIDQLKEMPPPSWLIGELVEEGVLAVLYGASGEGKVSPLSTGRSQSPPDARGTATL